MSLPLEKLPPKPVSGLKLTIGMLLIGVLAGGTAFWGISARATNVERLNARAQEAAVPTVLVVNPTKQADSLLKFELPGRVEPFTRAPIYSRIAGYLKSWKVDIGAVVKAGQLLAEIETPELFSEIVMLSLVPETSRLTCSIPENSSVTPLLSSKETLISSLSPEATSPSKTIPMEEAPKMLF